MIGWLARRSRQRLRIGHCQTQEGEEEGVVAVSPLTLLSQPVGQNLPHGAVCLLFVIQEVNDVIR